MSEGLVFGEQYAVVPDGILFSTVSVNARMLWIILQRYSDDDGRAWPARNRLAEIMGCSHDTVSRAKKELVGAGFLVVAERFDQAGRRTSDNLFLRGARRTGASGVRRTSASTNKEFDLDTERSKGPGDASVRRMRAPTDTTPIPSAKATPAERDLARRKLREIRQREDAS